MKNWSILVLCSVLLAALAGCAPAAVPQPTSAPAQPAVIKIAVLPILDVLPMYVAQAEGLYEKHGVAVEFIPVASAAERDQVIVAGQADGMINEVVSTILYNKDTVQLQIVRFARVATADYAQFHLMAAPRSNITTPADLKGVEIGISQGTVIEYLVDRLLAREGLTPDQIKTIAVPKISDRLALLASGELKAAMLPDPLSFLAQQQGAVFVLEDSKYPEYAFSTISFRKAIIDSQPEAVRGFLAAIEEATALINASPDKYRSLLSEKKLVPEPLMGDYKIGSYPAAGVPSEAQYKDVLDWALGKGIVMKEVLYSDSVNAGLLP
jgi:NitT/TauT family transport system substrate-binding protein